MSNVRNTPRKAAAEATVPVELPLIPNYLKVGTAMLPVRDIKRSVLRKVALAWMAEFVKRGRR